MTECSAIDPVFQAAKVEFCPADSDYPDLPIDNVDACISLIGLALTAAILVRSTCDKTTNAERVFLAVTEHFRFLLIAYFASERRLAGALRVMFDLVFPVYNLSLAAYPYTTYPLLTFVRFPGYFWSGCTAVFAWSTLLYGVAAACLLLTPTRPSAYTGICLFNVLSAPDIQFAVSAGFAGWGRTASYVKGTCCFSVSWFWSIFSLLMPACILESNVNYTNGMKVYTSEFRDGMKYWLLGAKTMQVALIYAIHFLRVYFAELPGYAFAVLLIIAFMYSQMQTTYWPYKLRFFNYIADDTHLSLILMTVWARYHIRYLDMLAFCLPLRQSWRVFEFWWNREKPAAVEEVKSLFAENCSTRAALKEKRMEGRRRRKNRTSRKQEDESGE